ncbi:MAG: hypothetical protein QW794_04120 [Thermosphaera sp.]
MRVLERLRYQQCDDAVKLSLENIASSNDVATGDRWVAEPTRKEGADIPLR